MRFDDLPPEILEIVLYEYVQQHVDELNREDKLGENVTRISDCIEKIRQLSVHFYSIIESEMFQKFLFRAALPVYYDYNEGSEWNEREIQTVTSQSWRFLWHNLVSGLPPRSRFIDNRFFWPRSSEVRYSLCYMELRIDCIMLLTRDHSIILCQRIRSERPQILSTKTPTAIFERLVHVAWSSKSLEQANSTCGKPLQMFRCAVCRDTFPLLSEMNEREEEPCGNCNYRRRFVKTHE